MYRAHELPVILFCRVPCSGETGVEIPLFEEAMSLTLTDFVRLLTDSLVLTPSSTLSAARS